MNNVPEAVLLECLDLLERGETIENIIAQHPTLAAELRPFLQTAAQLSTLAPQPSLAAKQQSQKLFLEHAVSLKVAPVRPSPWYRLRQILLPIASLALILILFVTSAVSVSASAIPGDALYSVKRLVENVRLNQANDPETAVALMEQYHAERIREVEVLLRTGRSADVMFDGEVEAIETDDWTVADIQVNLDEATEIQGRPQLGEVARVNGRTGNGELTASTIQMLTASATDPDPAPTPTLEPTSTLEPTATTEPIITATPIAPTTGPTVALTAVPTQPHTATPSPLPTTPPANDNDDDDDDNDDGGNDNDDDDDDNDDGGNDNDDDDGNSNDDDGNSNGDDGGNSNDDDDDVNSNDDDDGNSNDDDGGNDNDDDDGNSNDNDDDDGNDNGNDNDEDNENNNGSGGDNDNDNDDDDD